MGIPEELIKNRSDFNLVDFDEEFIKNNYELFYQDLNEGNLKLLKNLV